MLEVRGGLDLLQEPRGADHGSEFRLQDLGRLTLAVFGDAGVDPIGEVVLGSPRSGGVRQLSAPRRLTRAASAPPRPTLSTRFRAARPDRPAVTATTRRQPIRAQG